MALLLAVRGVVFAAEHTLPTKLFLLRNAGGTPTKRKAVFAEEQEKSPAAIVGDPTVNGARLWISLTDGAAQCFDLPAFAWSRVGTVGFRYKNLAGPDAIVGAAINKEMFSGDLILKWKARGSKGPIDIVPVAGNSGFSAVFEILDGDAYCAGGPTPSSGSTSTDLSYRVTRLPPPSACGMVSCSPSGAFPDSSEVP